MKTDKTKDMHKRLLTGILSAALVATIVPAAALADKLEVFQTSDETETMVLDGSEQDEPTEETCEQGMPMDAEDATAAIDTEAEPGKGVAGEEASVASAQGEGERAAAGRDGGQHVFPIGYIERGWDGERVTETHHDITSADVEEIPEDGVMDGGTYCPMRSVHFKERMVVKGDSKLILYGNAMVYADAGIHIEPGATLSVYSADDFVIFGDAFATLVVNADHGAGIGAYEGHRGGDLVVHGGILEVRGGEHCAGIGSNDGDGSDVGTFTMYGGKVTATGGDKGAGIGGGRKSEAKVRIYGGEVIATGGEDGAGIGGGEDGRGGSIEILGGDVTATGSTNASGIGGGENRDAGEVTISGGTVHAYHRDGAGIGGGEDGDGGTITITGGEVHSDYKGQGNGAGIGGGNHGGKGGTITISGGNVTAHTKHGAGIGGGRGAGDSGVIIEEVHNSGAGGTIVLTGGDITAISENGFGIGAGGSGENSDDTDHIGSGGDITIDGATVAAQGKVAGIGGDSGKLAIKGGKVTASAYTWREGNKENAHGDGVSFSDKKADIRISGGEVTLDGRGKDKDYDGTMFYCMGLYVCKHTINVTGGTVRVYADGNAVGCVDSSGGSLNISGKDTFFYAEGRNGAGISPILPAVNVKDGATLEAVAGGKDDNALNPSKLSIYDEASYGLVDEAGDCAWVNRADNKSFTRNAKGKHVLIHPCEHEAAAYDCDRYTHTRHCPHCKVDFGTQSHTFDGRGDCHICGYEHLYYNVTFISDSATGTHTVKADRRGRLKRPADPEPIMKGWKFDGWHLVSDDGTMAEEDYDFSQPLTHDIFLRARWVPRTVAFDRAELMNDGRIGLLFYFGVPEVERVNWQGSYVEMHVAGKGGKTTRIPLEDATTAAAHVFLEGYATPVDAYVFECPLSCIQLADEVTATFYNGKDEPLIEASCSAAKLIADVDGSGFGGAVIQGRANALADFGHYAQVQLARDNGWSFDENDGHKAVEAATEFNGETVTEAREGISRYGALEVQRCDSVSAVSTSVVLGSTATIKVSFTTDEDVESVTIDGKPAPEDAVTKRGKTVSVTIGGIRARELADAHEVCLTTTGSGDTTAAVRNLSVMTYASNALNSAKYANDTDVLYEMAALYRYHCDAKPNTEATFG